MGTKTTMVGIALLLAACGAHGGSNAIPENLRGHFPSGHLMGTDPFNVTVAANSFTIDGCDVNCGAAGVITIAVTAVTVDTDQVAHWTSADCTGTIERTGGSGGVSITSNPVPGLTGEAASNRAMKCALLDGGILTPG